VMFFLRHRWLLLAVSLLGYVLLFVCIGRVSGHGTATAGILPVLAAGLCWGWKAGLLAAVFAFPVNIFMMMLIGLDWKPGMLSGGGIGGHIAFLVIGALIGYMRDLYTQRNDATMRLQQEIDRRARDVDKLRDAEKRLEIIFEQSGDGILIPAHLPTLDSSAMAIQMVNKAFTDLLGYDRADVIDSSIFDFLPEVGQTYTTVMGDEIHIDPDYYEKSRHHMGVLQEQGFLRNWELYLVNRQHKLVPVEVTTSFMFNEQKEYLGAVSIVHDITHRKLFERELQLAKDFLENIIENSLDSIIISDATGHITSVNRAGITLLGYEREELLGQTPAFFALFDDGMYETTAGEQVWITQDVLFEAYARMEVFFKEGKISNHLFYCRRKDGRLVEAEANIAMLYSLQGEPIGSVSSMRDITARKRMEHELLRQRDQLAAANRELESFSYSVSHDLRAPLRSISGFASALTEDFGHVLPAEGRRYLERIRAAAGRMGSLIDDMLKLSRVTQHEMRREQVNLSTLAADIVAQFREQERGRDVCCTIQPGLIALGDGHLLRIALENLLDNAWKYTGPRPRAEIFFGIAAEGEGAIPEHVRGAAVYCVRDNGVGFDMAYADKLFGAFQRLHAELEFPGTGIGLATVQRILHRHGGRIWARSALDDGATFYFTLAQEG